MPQASYGTGPLTGLASEVPAERVQALLAGRAPDLLDDPDRHATFVEIVRGISTEVANIVGPNPVDWVRDSALWAISLGVASVLEESFFPEQQLGDAGRAAQLQVRYLGVLSDLRRNAPALNAQGEQLAGGSVRTVRLASSATSGDYYWGN